jgi:hypothetical protein
MNACEQFLQMHLDDLGILALAEDFQQIVISQKVKPGKFAPFFFQKVV